MPEEREARPESPIWLKGALGTAATALISGLVALVVGLIPKAWLADHLVWWGPPVVAFVALALAAWRRPDWVQDHPWRLGLLLGVVSFCPGTTISLISDRSADRTIGLSLGIRRVNGGERAQRDFSPLVQARPGDVLELEAIASIGGAPPQKGAGVRFTIPKTPDAKHPIQADYLIKPGKFGNGDTAEIRPASGLVRVTTPTSIVARSEYGGPGDPAPPQPRFVVQKAFANDLVEEWSLLVEPDFHTRQDTYTQLAIRLRVRVADG